MAVQAQSRTFFRSLWHTLVWPFQRSRRRGRGVRGIPAPQTLADRVAHLGKRDRDMLRVAEEAVRRGFPQQAIIAYSKAARFYMETGKDRKAAAVLNQLLKLAPEDVETVGQLVRCYENLGRKAEAADASFRCAELYEATGQSDKAVAALKKCAALDPRMPGLSQRMRRLDPDAAAELPAEEMPVHSVGPESAAGAAMPGAELGHDGPERPPGLEPRTVESVADDHEPLEFTGFAMTGEMAGVREEDMVVAVDPSDPGRVDPAEADLAGQMTAASMDFGQVDLESMMTQGLGEAESLPAHVSIAPEEAYSPDPEASEPAVADRYDEPDLPSADATMVAMGDELADCGDQTQLMPMLSFPDDPSAPRVLPEVATPPPSEPKGRPRFNIPSAATAYEPGLPAALRRVDGLRSDEAHPFASLADASDESTQPDLKKLPSAIADPEVASATPWSDADSRSPDFSDIPGDETRAYSVDELRSLLNKKRSKL